MSDGSDMKAASFLAAVLAGVLVVSALAADAVPSRAGEAAGQRVFLVRHAEKQGYGGNVPLSNTGKEQAELLAQKLADESIAAIYATDACRTIQTVMPLARSEAKKIIVYRAKDYRDFSLCATDWRSELLDKRLAAVAANGLTRAGLQDELKNLAGGAVLVAEHSEEICGWLESFRAADPGDCRSFACPWKDGKRYGDVFILSRSAPRESWTVDCTSLNFRLTGDAPD